LCRIMMSLSRVFRWGSHGGVRGKVGLGELRQLGVISDCARKDIVIVIWTCHGGAIHLKTIMFIQEYKTTMVPMAVAATNEHWLTGNQNHYTYVYCQ
jgi:hypothetical protein